VGGQRVVVAERDPSLTARVVRRVSMRYSAGADPASDRPAHVRAASGIAWVGSRVAVIQDDANFVALVDPATGLADPVALPPGAGGLRLFDDGRGNKADKLDHEALTSIESAGETLLVALGSGSTRLRESIALISSLDAPEPVIRVVVVGQFYSALRASTGFAGSELNVEGVVHVASRLRLFGRGNGAVLGDVRPVNATCDIDWAALRAHIAQPDHTPSPAPLDVIQYDLGSLGESRLTFTDAALGWSAGENVRPVFYLAAAEASPDVTRDGEVTGSAIGLIEERGGETTARWTELRGQLGHRLTLKAEGIAVVPHSPGRLLVVVDPDAYDQPSELLEVHLAGPWPGTRDVPDRGEPDVVAGAL
jgi:hypothetical protein